MNIAIIFAGGTGQRMNTKTKPKQFLEMHGKPILIYTLEKFQEHEEIDKIVLVCIASGIEYAWELINKYRITKVADIVPGGISGQLSIYNGVKRAHDLYGSDNVVLVHDGVRPLVDEGTISKAIKSVKENGSAITVAPSVETIAIQSEAGIVEDIMDRSMCKHAKAPQCFWLGDLFSAHKNALEEKLTDFIDSACLMKHYGYTLYTIEGTSENIKITTPIDFFILRAIIDAKENSQIFDF